MMEPIVISVDEVTGESTDAAEENLRLTFPKSAIPTLDKNAPFYATSFAEFGFTALSAAQSTGSVEVDAQETTGESADPEEGEVEAVVPKSLFVEVPDIHADLNAFTTGLALIIPS